MNLWNQAMRTKKPRNQENHKSLEEVGTHPVTESDMSMEHGGGDSNQVNQVGNEE